MPRSSARLVRYMSPRAVSRGVLTSSAVNVVPGAASGNVRFTRVGAWATESGSRGQREGGAGAADAGGWGGVGTTHRFAVGCTGASTDATGRAGGAAGGARG